MHKVLRHACRDTEGTARESRARATHTKSIPQPSMCSGREKLGSLDRGERRSVDHRDDRNHSKMTSRARK